MEDSLIKFKTSMEPLLQVILYFLSASNILIYAAFIKNYDSVCISAWRTVHCSLIMMMGCHVSYGRRDEISFVFLLTH